MIGSEIPLQVALVCVIVKLPLAATQLLPLPGTSAQVPMMVTPLSRLLLLTFAVPVTDELVSVIVSPADEGIVNENVPLIWSAEL